ncbi:putative FAD/NAD(P)-binding domain superfamily [Helianthus anomalus]
MSFTDFKFSEKVYGDPRMYPGHKEVLKFNTTVEVVESYMNGVISVEVFDAVVVCNGHNAQPRLATDIPAKKY